MTNWRENVFDLTKMKGSFRAGNCGTILSRGVNAAELVVAVEPSTIIITLQLKNDVSRTPYMTPI